LLGIARRQPRNSLRLDKEGRFGAIANACVGEQNYRECCANLQQHRFCGAPKLWFGKPLERKNEQHY
jgi:hypothetical protein